MEAEIKFGHDQNTLGLLVFTQLSVDWYNGQSHVNDSSLLTVFRLFVEVSHLLVAQKAVSSHT
jgi:hypothetical protein